MATTYYFLRGSSAGFTYVIPQGPIPVNWTMVSSPVQPKWFILGSIMEILQAGNALVLAWSNVSPTPKFNVPDRTVTRSTAGCQCGRTLVFAGNFTRKVKGTASVMGPSMTAILVPAGREATSVHCRPTAANAARGEKRYKI